MSGWFAVPVSSWEAMAAHLAGTVKWEEAMIFGDLRYFVDRCLGPEGVSAWPSLREFEARWKVGKSSVSRYLQRSSEWCDPKKLDAWTRLYFVEIRGESAADYDAAAALLAAITTARDAFGTPVGHLRDTHGTAVGQHWDSSATKNADNAPEMGHPWDSDGTPVGHPWDTRGDRRVGSTLPHSTLPHSTSATEDTGSGKPDAPPVEPTLPAWMRKAKLPASVDREEMFAVVVEVIAQVRGKAPNPDRCKLDGETLLRHWRALDRPPLDGWRDELLLVAEAAKDCPAPLFARDIRAEGWPDGTDRSRSLATLCVRDRWVDRLEAAAAWRDAGKPRSTGPPPTSRGKPSAMDALRAIEARHAPRDDSANPLPWMP